VWVRVNWYLPAVSWEMYRGLTLFDRECLLDALDRCIDLHQSEPSPGRDRKS